MSDNRKSEFAYIQEHPRNWEDEANGWIFEEPSAYFAAVALWTQLGEAGLNDRQQWVDLIKNNTCPIQMDTWEKQHSVYVMFNTVRVMCYMFTTTGGFDAAPTMV